MVSTPAIEILTFFSSNTVFLYYSNNDSHFLLYTSTGNKSTVDNTHSSHINLQILPLPVMLQLKPDWPNINLNGNYTPPRWCTREFNGHTNDFILFALVNSNSVDHKVKLNPRLGRTAKEVKKWLSAVWRTFTSAAFYGPL